MFDIHVEVRSNMNLRPYKGDLNPTYQMKDEVLIILLPSTLIDKNVAYQV